MNLRSSQLGARLLPIVRYRRFIYLVLFLCFLVGLLGVNFMKMKQTRIKFVPEIRRRPSVQFDRVPGELTTSTNLIQPKPKRHNVIILTHMSSGSTFTGNIFNIHPDVFFLYEPMHGLRRGKYGDELRLMSKERVDAFREEFSTLLRDVFSCKFEAPDTLRWIIHPWLKKAFMFWRFAFSEKSKETVSKACSSRQVTVAKLMQSRLPWPNGIQDLVKACSSDTGEFDCSIIHLVRDPRAMLSSLVRRAFFHGGRKRNLIVTRPISDEGRQLISNYSRLLCSQVEHNINFARQHPSWFTNRYKLFRYEDVIREPLNVTKAMYDFAGLPMVERIRKMLIEGIRPSEVPDRIVTFSLVEPVELINKWRTKLEPWMVSVFEEACLPLMKLTGYKPTYGSESLQHDLSQALLEKPLSILP